MQIDLADGQALTCEEEVDGRLEQVIIQSPTDSLDSQSEDQVIGGEEISDSVENLGKRKR